MNRNQVSRRTFLATTVAIGAAHRLRPATCAEPPKNNAQPTNGLGFSLYGMKSLTIDAALQSCAKIGYDCVEIPVLADWPADSRRISVAQRLEIRESLQRHRLRLSALMENLRLLADEKTHQDNLERLKLAAEMAHSLVPDNPPVIETVLGGSPAKWEETKAAMVERLGAWAEVATATKTTLAIKPHVGNALHSPLDTAWILQQVNRPALRAAYDYSHFALRGISIADSVKTLLPHAVFVHVKDETGTAEKFQFLLPGDGRTDYAELLKQIHAAGYRGDIVVEVSGQIHSRPGYEPLAAAERCYQHLAAAFTKAGVKRG